MALITIFLGKILTESDRGFCVFQSWPAKCFMNPCWISQQRIEKFIGLGPPGQAGPKLNPIHVGMNGIEAANSGTTTLRFLTINVPGDHYFDHGDHYFDDRKPGWVLKMPPRWMSWQFWPRQKTFPRRGRNDQLLPKLKLTFSSISHRVAKSKKDEPIAA